MEGQRQALDYPKITARPICEINPMNEAGNGKNTVRRQG